MTAQPAAGLDELVERLAADGQLVHLERIPRRPARFGTLATPLPADVAARAPSGGLWSHQVEAIDHLRAGRSVVIATGTSSGKSLCYQLPIAEAVVPGGATGARGTALLLHPTKALAHDQLRALFALDLPGVVPAAYDGDADPEARTWARRRANVVLTNPDMLHAGILPNHARWAPFLADLRYVVVDELHMLRGIFGTHAAHLLRRLRRICAHYGAHPTFCFTSATIGQPGRLAEALCGLPVEEVTADGSPQGERLFALWNPPLVDERAGARRSPNVDTASAVAGLVAAGHRVIAFAQSRKAVEVVAQSVGRALPSALADAVRPYRGGYLASERRLIEAELFSGQLRAVIATNALELGIDVGGLDACVLSGFPGTIAAMWQRAGRAGRGASDSLVILVAGSDQLDQWLMAHPKEVFDRPPEPAVVNPQNPFVLDPHLGCAAYELPLDPACDAELWGEHLDDGVRRLVLDDRLVLRNGRAVWAGRGSPARAIGLRNGGADEVRIVDGDGRLIGTVDHGRAFGLVHPGAVYLHQGRSWQVRELDLEDRAAWVEPHDGGDTTRPHHDTEISVLSVEQSQPVGAAMLRLGSVMVTEQVTGYQRTELVTGEVLEDVALELPPTQLVTRAFWYEIDPATVARAGLGLRQLAGSLHAAEHAGIGILPLFTICDRWDVGGVSVPKMPGTGLPTIFIYDGYAGGAGIAELGFSAGRRHLAAILDVIDSCPCEAGCPSCVQSPKCGNGNDPLDKGGAAALLATILLSAAA